MINLWADGLTMTVRLPSVRFSAMSPRLCSPYQMNRLVEYVSAFGPEITSWWEPREIFCPLNAGFPSNVAMASIACPCNETLNLSRVFSINRWCVRMPNITNTRRNHHNKGRRMRNSCQPPLPDAPDFSISQPKSAQPFQVDQ